jgi:hypothetical protein
MEQVNMIRVSELDDMVEKTYQKYYNFQQQEGCKEREVVFFDIPTPGTDFDRDTIPEVINGDIMGVSFKAWLERDPKEILNTDTQSSSWATELFWGRNFYPHPEILLNDLYAKGLIPAGKLAINIDW